MLSSHQTKLNQLCYSKFWWQFATCLVHALGLNSSNSCAMKWMRACISNFSTDIGPLATFMEQVYAVARKLTPRAKAKGSLKYVGWNNIPERFFQLWQHALENQVALFNVHFARSLACSMTSLIYSARESIHKRHTKTLPCPFRIIHMRVLPLHELLVASDRFQNVYGQQ